MKRICHTVITWIVFKVNDVVFVSFRSNGVPVVHRSDCGNIILGKCIYMNNGLAGNCIGYNSPCIFRAEGGNINIGDNVGMSQTVLVAKSGGDITIGNNVLLGGGVKIYTSDFHSLDYMDRRNRQIDVKNRKTSSVSIGDDCFIGAGTIILKGVNIGPRVVIGAGSVVTKSIPADSIAAGNPCSVINQRQVL